MSNKKIPDDDTLKKLYEKLFDFYKYHHSDVWRGQQYYTTLNVAIISIAFTLLGVDLIPKSSLWVIIPIFGVGIVTSLFGFLTLKKLRKYFLRNITFKTLIEFLMKDKLELTINGLSEKHKLTPFYPIGKEDISAIIDDPDTWIKQNTYRKWGITLYFLILHGIFIGINIIGVIITIVITIA